MSKHDALETTITNRICNCWSCTDCNLASLPLWCRPVTHPVTLLLAWLSIMLELIESDVAAKNERWTFHASPRPWCVGHSTLYDECNFTTIERYFFEAPAMANSLHWRNYLPQQRHENLCVGPLQMPHVTKNRINMSFCFQTPATQCNQLYYFSIILVHWMSRPQPQGWIKMFTSLACSIKLGEVKVGTEWCHWHVFHQLYLFHLYRHHLALAPCKIPGRPPCKNLLKDIELPRMSSFQGASAWLIQPIKK